jgi:hypothetical protein
MPTSEAEQEAMMQEWTTWFGQLGSAVVDGGNPIVPLAKTISSDGKVATVPAAMMASGYSVIKASSLDAAVALAKGCPVLKGGASIAVFETHNADGSKAD